MVEERAHMPNALFAYANSYFLLGLFVAILFSALVEAVIVVILFLTPKLRSCILASLCEDVDGRVAARFVGRELEARQVWTLCAVGLKSPKHFTHVVGVIQKELSLNQIG